MKNEFYIEMCKNHIKMSKRILRANYALLILNTALFIYFIVNVYMGYTNSWFGGVGIGCSGCTSFWIWLNIWEIRMDIKIEKEELSWREKYNETGEASLFA